MLTIVQKTVDCEKDTISRKDKKEISCTIRCKVEICIIYINAGFRCRFCSAVHLYIGLSQMLIEGGSE